MISLYKTAASFEIQITDEYILFSFGFIVRSCNKSDGCAVDAIIRVWKSMRQKERVTSNDRQRNVLLI
jgi:hypothetical protein